MPDFPVIAPFDIPSISVTFEDWGTCTPGEIQDGKEILWELLQGQVLNGSRPGVSLCGVDPANDGCDNSLPMVNFVVFETRTHDVVGSFNLYNIVEQSPPNKSTVVISTMVVPGFYGIGGVAFKDAWGAAIAHLVSNQLAFEDGRILVIEQIDFPIIKGHEWNVGAEDIFVAASNELTVDTSGRPLKLRKTVRP